MRKIILLLALTITFEGYSQISFYSDKDLLYPDLRVRIGNDVLYPDVRVRIGENVTSHDFTVGITDRKSNADFIIVNSKYKADKTVRASSDVLYPDIRIKVGDDVLYPDVRIKIKKSGTVDYIVYTENSYMDLSDLVIALLPAINKHLDYKLENIPFHIQANSNYSNSSTLAPSSNSISLAIEMLRNATIVAQDDERTFLGTITNEFNANSIFNDFGTYGSDLSSNSIWNDIGTFGSDISSYSPFNDITSTPPMIVKNGQIIGYLTVNEIISGAISPYILKGLKDKF